MSDNGDGGGDAGGDLNISKTTLDQITKGLRDAIGELKESGSTGQTAQMGSGMEELALKNMETGHGGLADDFADFCDRWEWGVRALITDANAIAERLGLAAGLHYEQDRYWSETFKGAVHASNLLSDPGQTPDEINSQGWTDLMKPDAPDYSQESADEAKKEISETWSDPEGKQPTLIPPTGGDGEAEGDRR